MNDAQRSAGCVRFGAFEFNPQTGELLKHGLKIKLSGQPIELLVMLLERPGQLVTREELQKRLWPHDTVVEFEHSINAAINRLREALSDSADAPRYVETLPRRGYRFIAPAEVIASPPGAAPLVAPGSPQVPAASEPRSVEAPSAEGAEEASTDLVGQTVSHYRVLDRIDSGAMGVVYRAEDTRLGRTVALKFLPAEWAPDRQSLARFQREARTASALNHPNICTIHDIDEHAGQPFIAMELLEGETLKERLAVASISDRRIGGQRPPLPLETLLDLATQIAAGLEAAHGKGIIHRDIKPANIFLTIHGHAKILDFGIAKLTVAAVSDRRSAMGTSPLQQAAARTGDTLTIPGSLIGTAAYMSPEQARGEALDARTDIFSFGAVLYEMATGRQAFPGRTLFEVQQAILTQHPVSPKTLYADLPSKLEEIIYKALEKNRELRYQSARDMRADLQRLKRDTDSGRAVAPTITAERVPTPVALPRPLWGKWVVASGCAALIVAAGFAFLLTRPLPPPKILSSVQVTHDGRSKGKMVTDGPRIYFVETSDGGSWGLGQVSASGGETAIIPTSIQFPDILDISPAQSELLVARGSAYGESQLTVLPLPAGPAHRLGDIMAHDGTWSPDGQKIVYTRGSELYVARSDGSGSQKLAGVVGTALMLRWSPDGARLRFTLVDRTTGSHALWEVLADGSKLHPLLPGWNNPPAECCGNWTMDGKYFVFESQRNGHSDIWAWRENGGPLRKSARQPVRLTAGPMDTLRPVPSTDGKKLFVMCFQARGELARYDSNSGQFAPYLSGISAEGVDFSRDGKWVVYVEYPEGTLWRSHVDASERLQLTYPPMRAALPNWAPDGKRIAFCGMEPGRPFKIYIVSVDGGTPRQATSEERNECDPTWAPDGNSLAFGRLGQIESTKAIHVLDIQSQRVTTLPGSDGFIAPRWSPDGSYIVAQPIDQQKLFLFDVKSKKWSELVDLPAGYYSWSRDGKFLYFDVPVTNEPAIYRVRVADRQVERLVSQKGYRRAMGEFGAWMGLAPNNSPLVLHDVGVQDIYALDVDFP